jgi:hypothetical protein
MRRQAGEGYSFKERSTGPFGEDIAGNCMTPDNFFGLLAFERVALRRVNVNDSSRRMALPRSFCEASCPQAEGFVIEVLVTLGQDSSVAYQNELGAKGTEILSPRNGGHLTQSKLELRNKSARQAART